MKAMIVNLTATGGWQELPDVPHGCLSISLQVRTSADMQYRYAGRSQFWTIKADTTRTLISEVDQADIEVQGTAADVIEIEYNTIGYAL